MSTIYGIDLAIGPPFTGVTYWLGDQQVVLPHRFTSKRRCKCCGARKHRTRKARPYPYCLRCVL
jgi:hypothetical protein